MAASAATNNKGEQPLFLKLTLPEGLEECVESLARVILHSEAKESDEIIHLAKEHFNKMKDKAQNMTGELS